MLSAIPSSPARSLMAPRATGIATSLDGKWVWIRCGIPRFVPLIPRRTFPGPYLGNYDRDGRRVGRAEAHAPKALVHARVAAENASCLISGVLQNHARQTLAKGLPVIVSSSCCGCSRQFARNLRLARRKRGQGRQVPELVLHRVA